MGISGGPDMIQDGLVLALDASDRNSYPGSGTVWSDMSGNGNNGTLTNGPIFNTENGGNISFDGSNDYASLGSFPGLGISNRSVDVLFKINSLSPSGNRRVFSFVTDDTTTDTPSFTLGYATTNTSLGLGFGGTPYNGGVSLPPFSLSTWMYVAGTINGNFLTVYQNGNVIGTATNTGAVGTNQIGYIARYNASYGQYGNVQVASLRLYNRALSASEVLQNYNAIKSRFNL